MPCDAVATSRIYVNMDDILSNEQTAQVIKTVLEKLTGTAMKLVLNPYTKLFDVKSRYGRTYATTSLNGVINLIDIGAVSPTKMQVALEIAKKTILKAKIKAMFSGNIEDTKEIAGATIYTLEI